MYRKIVTEYEIGVSRRITDTSTVKQVILIYQSVCLKYRCLVVMKLESIQFNSYQLISSDYCEENNYANVFISVSVFKILITI